MFLVLVLITFLSYYISDKAMVWILSNALLIGTYAYTREKTKIVGQFEKIWETVTEMSRKVIERIPKEKDE